MDLGNNLISFENHVIKSIRDLHNLFVLMDLPLARCYPEDIHLVKEVDTIFYDETDCGAHIQDVTDEGFNVSCIVEGSDAEFLDYIKFPVHSQNLGAYLCDLDARAHDAWFEANSTQDMVQG